MVAAAVTSQLTNPAYMIWPTCASLEPAWHGPVWTSSAAPGPASNVCLISQLAAACLRTQYGCACDDCENPNLYPKARFVSEFGVQSYPTYDTLRTSLSRADSYVDSGNMYWRQRKFSNAPSSVFNWAALHFRMAGDCEWLLPGLFGTCPARHLKNSLLFDRCYQLPSTHITQQP